MRCHELPCRILEPWPRRRIHASKIFQKFVYFDIFDSLLKFDVQEPLSPKSPQNRSHPSLQSLQSDSPRRERDTDGRDGRDGRDVSLHTFLERYERDEDDTRKPRPKTAALYRGKTTEMEPKVSTKTTRAESEHGRRCTGQRWTKWNGPCVQLDKDVPLDEMSLSPSRTVRSRCCLRGIIWFFGADYAR